MKTTNHTPGPWALLDRAENSRTLTHITNGAHIVCTLGTTRSDGSPNHSANAHLIASAPDLLSALRFLLADYIAIEGEKLTGSSVPADMARAAIAKAEGVA
jgi:hypothetical protein